jgi:hypothetical protein
MNVIFATLLALAFIWLGFLTFRHADLRADAEALARAILLDSKTEARRILAKLRKK